MQMIIYIFDYFRGQKTPENESRKLISYIPYYA